MAFQHAPARITLARKLTSEQCCFLVELCILLAHAEAETDPLSLLSLASWQAGLQVADASHVHKAYCSVLQSCYTDTMLRHTNLTSLLRPHAASERLESVMLIVHVLGCAGHGRMHAAEQRKERESLEELIHSIQLESELTSRAFKQTVSVSFPVCLTHAWASVHVSVCFTHAWTSVHMSVLLAGPLYVCMFSCHGVLLLSEARLQSQFACVS